MSLPAVTYFVIIGTGAVKAYVEFGTGVPGLTAARAYALSLISKGHAARVTYR